MKRKQSFSLIFGIIFTAIIIFPGQNILAATKNWVGTVDSLATNALNWSGAAIPVSGDALVFPAGKTVWNMSGIVPAAVSSAAALTLNEPLIVSGDLTLSDGILDLNGRALNVGGNLIFVGGGINAGTSGINISGNWDYQRGENLLTANRVIINGAGLKTIKSGEKPFGFLSVDANGGTVRVLDNLFANNGFALNGGDFELNGYALNVLGGMSISGGVFNAGNGKLVFSGTNGRPLVVSGGEINLTSANAEYSIISGSVSIEPLEYGTLSLGGKAIYALTGATTAKKSLVVKNGATFSSGGYVLNVPSGVIENEGVIGEGKIVSPALSLTVSDTTGKSVSDVKQISSSLIVALEDRNLNRRGDTREVVPAAVTLTTVSGDRETILVTETDEKSGVFKSKGLVLHQGSPQPGNNLVDLGQNDVILIDYIDPQDATDKKNLKIIVNLSSAINSSGAPQIIGEPRVGSFSGLNTSSGMTYGARVEWETDVLSSSSVSVTAASLTAPIAAGSLDGVTAHSVAIAGLKYGLEYSFTVSSVTAEGRTVQSKVKKFKVIAPGDRIKSASSPAVYWYLNGKRAVFADLNTYDSWFGDWKGIIAIPAEQLAEIPLDRAVPVKGGTYLIKISSDPKTYAVEPGGKLRWIKTESQAVSLFGKDWSRRVRDVDVSQFVNYSIGDALAEGEAPSGFVYRISGSEVGAVIGKTFRPFSETARRLNSVNERFISTILPGALSALSAGSEIVGYENELNSVIVDGKNIVTAPIASAR
jgi:hypothetical protein